MSTYYVSDTVLSTEGPAVNKTNDPCRMLSLAHVASPIPQPLPCRGGNSPPIGILICSLGSGLNHISTCIPPLFPWNCSGQPPRRCRTPLLPSSPLPFPLPAIPSSPDPGCSLAPAQPLLLLGNAHLIVLSYARPPREVLSIFRSPEPRIQ